MVADTNATYIPVVRIMMDEVGQVFHGKSYDELILLEREVHSKIKSANEVCFLLSRSGGESKESEEEFCPRAFSMLIVDCQKPIILRYFSFRSVNDLLFLFVFFFDNPLLAECSWLFCKCLRIVSRVKRVSM